MDVKSLLAFGSPNVIAVERAIQALVEVWLDKNLVLKIRLGVKIHP